MINQTQWQIYNKVSQLTTEAWDKHKNTTEPCSPEWYESYGYAKALSYLSYSLLQEDFISCKTSSFEISETNDKSNS